MSCSPSYAYRPTDRPTPGQSSAVGFEEHRSRLFNGGTYFRSIEQGEDQNDISLEAIVTSLDATLNVRVLGILEESFTVPQVDTMGMCSGGIADLRSAVASSNIIEMPVRGTDIFDSGSDDSSNCITPFPDTSMTGGAGAPSSANQMFLDSIFTGTERTLIVVTTTEDFNGNPVDPPLSRKVQQWDGNQWITYTNLIPGSCPVDGPPI